MTAKASIEYRDFYDVPRVFIVSYENKTFLFDCPFSEVIDDYPPEYDVYLMTTLREAELRFSWENIKSKVIRKLGTVPVDAVKFDSTRRREIDTEVLGRITAEEKEEGSKTSP